MKGNFFSTDDYESFSRSIGMFHGKTNVGIFTSGGSIYCIDTGNTDNDADALCDCIAKLFPGKQIKAVLSTHSHADHSGANARVIEHTGAEVWAPYNESRLMEFPEVMSSLYWGSGPLEELTDEYFVSKKPCAISRTLSAGEKIELEDVSIECIPLPGHFYDQMGFCVTDLKDGKKVLFSGDGFFGKEMLKKYWIPFMYDPVAFRESVERIEGTQADFYIPGHGGVYDKTSISAIAEMNIIVTLETETLILKTLGRLPLTHEELLEAVADFAGLDLKLSQFVLIGSTLKSYLSSMCNRKMISYKIEDNRMLWSCELVNKDGSAGGSDS